jgi:hypothetical protein
MLNNTAAIVAKGIRPNGAQTTMPMRSEPKGYPRIGSSTQYGRATGVGDESASCATEYLKDDCQ